MNPSMIRMRFNNRIRTLAKRAPPLKDWSTSTKLYLKSSPWRAAKGKRIGSHYKVNCLAQECRRSRFILPADGGNQHD
jgi:hypothetical protein